MFDVREPGLEQKAPAAAGFGSGQIAAAQCAFRSARIGDKGGGEAHWSPRRHAGGGWRRRLSGSAPWGGGDQTWSGCEITGTSTLLALLSESPACDPIISNLLCVTGGWAAFTIVDAAGDAMRWARMLLHDAERGYEDINSLAETAPPGSEQLLFLPYLNAERLARKSNSRAQFFGLTSGHTAAHLHRAVMEGVGFASNKNFEFDEGTRISLRSDGRCRRRG